MKNTTINLRDLLFVVADPNSYLCMIVHSMLRSFGANKVIEVRNSLGVVKALTGQKIDILLCDAKLPPHGGPQAHPRHPPEHQQREPHGADLDHDRRHPCATIRPRATSGRTWSPAKPMSPSSLYDRLAWIAFNPRQFIDTATYFSPDRRFKIEGYPSGVGRRKATRRSW